MSIHIRGTTSRALTMAMLRHNGKKHLSECSANCISQQLLSKYSILWPVPEWFQEAGQPLGKGPTGCTVLVLYTLNSSFFAAHDEHQPVLSYSWRAVLTVQRIWGCFPPSCLKSTISVQLECKPGQFAPARTTHYVGTSWCSPHKEPSNTHCLV